MPISYSKVNLIELAKPAGTSIYSLPDDVLLLIISFVDVKDILKLRQVSAVIDIPKPRLSKLHVVQTDRLTFLPFGLGQ